MTITENKIITYSKALESLHEAILYAQSHSHDESFEFLRDAVIQRFEYTIELWRKLLKNIIETVELDNDSVKSPKDSLRMGYQYEYVSDVETTLKMMKDRNTLSHSYSEQTSEEIYDSIITSYYDILFIDFQTLQQKIK